MKQKAIDKWNEYCTTFKKNYGRELILGMDSPHNIPIREYRKKKGLTQEELGKLIGLSNFAISKYEKGIVKNIPFRIRIMLHDILDIPYELIITETEYSNIEILTSCNIIMNESFESRIKEIINNNELYDILMNKINKLDSFLCEKDKHEIKLFADSFCYTDDGILCNYVQLSKIQPITLLKLILSNTETQKAKPFSHYINGDTDHEKP